MQIKKENAEALGRGRRFLCSSNFPVSEKRNILIGQLPVKLSSQTPKRSSTGLGGKYVNDDKQLFRLQMRKMCSLCSRSKSCICEERARRWSFSNPSDNSSTDPEFNSS